MNATSYENALQTSKSGRSHLAVAIAFVFALVFAGRTEAATYYVSTQGNDGNSCASAQSTSQASHKATISAGVACLSAGDTLFIRGGVYTGRPNTVDTQSFKVASGTSWANPVTIAGMPGETVTIRPPYNTAAVRLNGSSYQYIIFQDFTVDSSLSTAGADAVGIFAHDAHHIRYQRLDVKTSRNFGFSISLTSHHNELLDNYIHDNGYPNSESTNGHGIYITGCDNVIAGNTISDNQGYGIHMYNNAGSHDCPSRNVIRNNKFYGNGRHGSPAYAIVVSWGFDNLIYNNLIVGNRGGIQVYTEASNTGIYNNTIYGNNDEGIALQYHLTGQMIRNNIMFNNGVNFVDYGGAAKPTVSNNLMTEPGFVNAAGGDYSLQSWSAARNTGMTISVVKNDFIGTARPQDGVFDIGALEFLGSKAPAAPANVRIVTN